MAKHTWIGGATATAQVDTLTVGGTVEADDVFNVTLTGEDGTAVTLPVVAGSTTIATVCTNIASAFNASTNALFTGITAVAGATTVTLTADTAGVPFFCTVTTTESGGGGADAQTFARAATTANSGPKDFGTAANWSSGSVPANSDDWDADGRATDDVRYSLIQSTKTFGLVRVFQSFTKSIGALGGYKLKMGCTNCLIGEQSQDGGTGGGSSLINISFHTVAGTCRVKKTRNTGTSGKAPVQLLPGENTFDVIVEPGSVVGIGTDVVGESVALNELHVHGGRVEVGEGTTFGGSSPAVNQTGGEVVLRGSVATINQDAGDLTTEGAGTVTTANVAGGLVANSTGTITNLEVKNSGRANFTQSTQPRTVTNATVVGPAARILANNGKPLSITFTNGVDFVDGASTGQCDMGDEVNAAYTAA